MLAGTGKVEQGGRSCPDGTSSALSPVDHGKGARALAVEQPSWLVEPMTKPVKPPEAAAAG